MVSLSFRRMLFALAVLRRSFAVVVVSGGLGGARGGGGGGAARVGVGGIELSSACLSGGGEASAVVFRVEVLLFFSMPARE